MNDVDYMQIIKWVLIVLLAGFIGQFGKSFAKYLMERARRKKAAEMTGLSEPKVPETSLPGTTTPEQTADTENRNDVRTENAKEEAKKKKKELKALAKLQKKEAKAAKKEQE